MTSGPSVSCIILSTSYNIPYTVTLRPNGNGVDDFFTPYDWNGPTSSLTNWECVDDVNQNGATDYNLLIGPLAFPHVVLQDYFAIESLPSTVDIVNDIFKTLTVVSVAEFVDFNDVGMPTNIDYRNILYLGSIYTSDKLNIGYFNPTNIPPYNITLPVGMNGWKGVSYTWGNNPATTLPWEWVDLTGMNIGYETSVPSQYNIWTNGLFSDLNGDSQQLHPSTPSAGDNWWCVMNYDTRYIDITVQNTYLYDLYKRDVSHSYWGYPWNPLNVITNVRVCATIAEDDSETYDSSDRYAKTVLKTYATEYVGSAEGACVASPNYTIIYTDYPLNPFTNAAWTATELDDAQFGVGMWRNNGSRYVYCNSVYLDVTYIHPSNGEVATTQVYAVINAEHPENVICKLPQPEWGGIQVNQDIETMGLNFWSGNREVYGLGRSSKRTVLSGVIWDGCTDGSSTCEQIIACIRSMGKIQKPILLTGLDNVISDYSSLCTNYNLISFAWRQNLECGNNYYWQLELEWCA